MSFLADLWLPILLSAVFVFIASSVIHMALPWHRSDVRKLDAEDAILDAMRTHGAKPGAYMFPCAASMKDMGSPEMQAKFDRGPVGWLTIVSGPWNMGKSLSQWFAYCLIVSFLVAYVARLAMPDGTAYLQVFRVVGPIAWLGHGIGAMHDSIWKGQRWSVTGKFIVDGLVYALVVAGTFGWMWPSAGG